MKKKRLPIGVSDFKTLINDNYYFVDKSMLIDELLEKKIMVSLIPRPKRFGKTLSMSMIDNFFNIEKREVNKNLFNGLAITNTDKMQYMGEYPVIYLSFKDIKVNNWKECWREIKNLTSDLFLSKIYLRESLNDIQLKNFNDILMKKEDADYLNSLKDLSKYLYEKYGKKVVILIDEYDTPLISAHYNGYYKEAIGFFRNFLSSALKDNVYLELSMLTGILRIAKESIFSGLNNLSVSTILDEDFNHFGLKEDEVEEMLRYYGLTYELDEVKKWYNGYTFGTEKVYNPWSIIN